MTPTDCERFDELLDLYAAGECDPGSASLVRAHLDDCPRCRESLRHSRELLGLLDLHFREEEALTRLGGELRRQARRDRPAPAHLKFVRPLAALAAMLLVFLGMGLWLDPGPGVRPPPALLEVSPVSFRPPPGVAMSQARAHADRAVPGKKEGPPPITVEVQRREDLAAAWRAGRLPLPPHLRLELKLKNPGRRALHVRVGGPSFACRLELSGGEVRRVPARGEKVFTPVEPTTLTIPPGGEGGLRWDGLVEVEDGRVYYLYPLAAGDHALSVRLRVEAWHDGERPKTVWLAAASGARVRVAGRK